MNFYFTFGFGTTHRNNFVVIDAASDEDAREQIMAKIGNKFAFCYTDSDWFDERGESQQERYGLTPIALDDLIVPQYL